MAKGQKRSNREAKKPKKDKIKVSVAPASAGSMQGKWKPAQTTSGKKGS